MGQSQQLVEVWRGDILESRHRGHAVICDAKGQVLKAWGDPDQVILPRSSVKMLQALPLARSFARRDLGDRKCEAPPSEAKSAAPRRGFANFYLRCVMSARKGATLSSRKCLAQAKIGLKPAANQSC